MQTIQAIEQAIQQLPEAEFCELRRWFTELSRSQTGVWEREQAGQFAAQIGVLKDTHTTGLLTLETVMGIRRSLDLLSGEQLPRIC